MNISKDVFKLIKSLTRHEKAYFKRFATAHSPANSNNYTILFDAIDRLADYDEQELRKKLAGQSFIRHLPTVKHQLAGQVLSSLAAYNAESQTSAGLYALLNSVENLYRRGLYSFAAKKLARARKQAAERDAGGLLLEILEWKRKLLLVAPWSVPGDELNDLHRDIQDTLASIQGTADYASLRDEVFALTQLRLPDPEQLLDASLSQFARQEVIARQQAVQSFGEERLRLSALGLLAQLRGDFNAAREFHGTSYSRWMKSATERHARYDEFIDEATRYAACCAITGRAGSFSEVLQAIESVKADSFTIEAKVFESTVYLKQLHSLQNGMLADARDVCRILESGLNTYDSVIRDSHMLTLLYNAGIAHFVSGDFAASLEYLNRILNAPPGPIRQDLQDSARILRLLVYFELEDYELLETKIRSASRFFRKHRKHTTFAMHSLRHLKKTGPLGRHHKGNRDSDTMARGTAGSRPRQDGKGTGRIAPARPVAREPLS